MLQHNNPIINPTNHQKALLSKISFILVISAISFLLLIGWANISKAEANSFFDKLKSASFLSSSSSNKKDADCPIDIQSDRGDFNNKTGNATHAGNVIVVQGTRHLCADTLTIHRDTKGKIDKMEALGSPASFEIYMDPNKPKLTGKAKIIQYFPKEDKIVLLEDAELIQNQQSIQGPIIHYLLDKKILSSESNANKRTTLTIIPKETTDIIPKAK